MRVLDLDITANKLIPPIGNMWKYRAIVRFLSIITDEGKTKIVQPGLGETYGKTEDEACKKMQEKFDEWLKE